MSDAPLSDPPAPGGQLLIYQDGGRNLQVRLDGQTVWLTQAGMAELYQTSKQNISLHLQNLLDENELPPTASNIGRGITTSTPFWPLATASVPRAAPCSASGRLPASANCS